MAEFTVQSSFIYNIDGTFDSIETGFGVLEDGETTPPGETTFELGDTFTVVIENPDSPGTFVPITGSYAGFLTDFDGETVPVIFSDDPLVLFAFGNPVYVVASSRISTDVTQPSSIDFASALDTDPLITCFLPGTAIATPTGAVAVEKLAADDAILTADGRVVSVRWVGRQTVSTRFGPAERLRPVRIAAGAFGPDIPARDLCLTADHALLFDGVLINAGALVNGTTITRMPLSKFDGSYTVYHVETEDHDIILAEGVPSETYVDYVGRMSFDNHAEFVSLYGTDRSFSENPAPRITSARQVPSHLRERLGLDHAA